MTKIIAFANHKGGCGKSCSVASVGACLASKVCKTLLVDLDGQSNLTSCYLPDDDSERGSIYDSIINGEPLPIITIAKNLDIIPSSLEMAGAEIALTNVIAREQVLSHSLENVREAYDYILIDCPPSLGIVTTNAILAATDVLVPMTPELLPLKGMSMLDNYIESLKVVKRDIHISGVFITRYNNRKLNKVVDSVVHDRYTSIAFNTKIRENIALAECPGSKCSIFEYSPASNGAKDYADHATVQFRQ